MHKTWQRTGRVLLVLALSGVTLGLMASSLGCDYATYNNIEAMVKASGEGVIDAVSNGLLGKVGKDFDTVVRDPATQLAKDVWGNWINTRIPQDVPPPYGSNLVRP